MTNAAFQGGIFVSIFLKNVILCIRNAWQDKKAAVSIGRH